MYYDVLFDFVGYNIINIYYFTPQLSKQLSEI